MVFVLFLTPCPQINGFLLPWTPLGILPLSGIPEKHQARLKLILRDLTLELQQMSVVGCVGNTTMRTVLHR